MNIVHDQCIYHKTEKHTITIQKIQHNFKYNEKRQSTRRVKTHPSFIWSPKIYKANPLIWFNIWWNITMQNSNICILIIMQPFQVTLIIPPFMSNWFQYPFLSSFGIKKSSLEKKRVRKTSIKVFLYQNVTSNPSLNYNRK